MNARRHLALALAQRQAYQGLAQLGIARLPGGQEVAGSNPASLTWGNDMLQIGDKVVVIRDDEIPAGGSLLHRTGVVANRRDGNMTQVGVRFDESFLGGHELNGACTRGHGWYINERCLQKMEPLAELIKKTFMKGQHVF